jgi:Xaa-Pro aminopeptidase
MMTKARGTLLACGILAVAFNSGIDDAGAQIPSKAASAEMRFWEWTSLDFPAEEYAARRERLLGALAADGGGILIVPGDHGVSHGETFRQLDDFHYLTGLEVPASLLTLDADGGEVMLFTPRRDARFENPGRPNDFPGRPLGDDPMVATVSGLEKIVDATKFESYVEAWMREGRLFRVNGGRPGALGPMKSEALPDWSPQELLLLHLRTTRPEARIRNAFEAIARVRSVLSPAEIEMMRRAAELTVHSIREAAGWVTSGVDERTLEGRFQLACKEGGSQRVAFHPIIKSGPNSLRPWRILTAHYDRRNRQMTNGDLVIFDVGCELNHYVSDVGRTFPVSGRFTPDQRQALELSTSVSDAIIAAVRPGITLRDLQEVAEKNIPGDQRKYMQTGLYFGHHIGLSTGPPVLTDQPLEPGMVFTVEPWYYNHDDQISVFVEDVVLVTETGVEVLTRELPRRPGELERMVLRR